MRLNFLQREARRLDRDARESLSRARDARGQLGRPAEDGQSVVEKMEARRSRLARSAGRKRLFVLGAFAIAGVLLYLSAKVHIAFGIALVLAIPGILIGASFVLLVQYFGDTFLSSPRRRRRKREDRPDDERMDGPGSERRRGARADPRPAGGYFWTIR